jgi:NAD(P)-dependent dehydrogenase (short-subunit alcohol dehydrogenase family)
MNCDDDITTPFGAQSTAAEVIAGVDLSGRRAIVTGASSGIGVETARALASAGAEVILAVRDVDAGERVADDITSTSGNRRVLVGALDLADQASVAAFVARWAGALHILVNNAGIMATPKMRTREGWEMQFATNHLGHFALATELHDSLAAAGGARVVVVSSVGHINGEVLFEDINFDQHPYDPWAAYRQSKTANVLFMVEANRRWGPDHIRVNALHPGRIADTSLTRYIGGVSNAPVMSEPRQGGGLSWKTIEQGAATSVLLAASPLLEGVGGRYFEDCNEAGPVKAGILGGVAPFAVDPDKAARLWQASLAMLAGEDHAAPSSNDPIDGSSR